MNRSAARSLALSAALLALAACTETSAPAVATTGLAPSAAPAIPSAPLRVGATREPHAALLRAVEPELKAQGVTLAITVYEDYLTPNSDVARGALDANFFQTEPYLWRWRAAHMAPLVVAGRVHVEPMGLYSRKLTAALGLSKIRDGAIVAVPQDPANLGRSLMLLQRAGLLEVDDRRGLDAAVPDITSNPHQLKFRELPAEKMMAELGSADLVALNGNFALEAKLKPADALYREGADSPFPNVVVAREDHAQDPRVVALVAALRGPTAQKLMADKYEGAALPAQ